MIALLVFEICRAWRFLWRRDCLVALRRIRKGRAIPPNVAAIFGVQEARYFAGIRGEKTKKNTFFEKQSGELIDNKRLATKNKAEQTEKQSGEVVENTFLWKKQS